MSIRTLKLGQLETLRKESKKLEAQAANCLAIIAMKSVTTRKDYAALDVDALYQAAHDLRATVHMLRETNHHASELHAELYD